MSATLWPGRSVSAAQVQVVVAGPVGSTERFYQIGSGSANEAGARARTIGDPVVR